MSKEVQVAQYVSRLLDALLEPKLKDLERDLFPSVRAVAVELQQRCGVKRKQSVTASNTAVQCCQSKAD